MATPQQRPVPIPKYRFPTGARGAGTLLCAVLMLLSPSRQSIAPGSFLFDKVLSKSQSVAQHAEIGQDTIFYLLFGSHTLITLYFAATKLQKHNGRFLSKAGIAWIATVFVGGKVAEGEFDLAVAEEARANTKAI